MGKDIEEQVKDYILNYGFYNENHQYVVVLDKEKLKKMFDADIILLEENYG